MTKLSNGKIVALIEANFWANSRDLGPYFQSYKRSEILHWGITSKKP